MQNNILGFTSGMSSWVCQCGLYFERVGLKLGTYLRQWLHFASRIETSMGRSSMSCEHSMRKFSAGVW